MFESFATWQDVLDAARAGVWLHYHAPMDLRPSSVRVVKVFKNGKIRIDPGTSGADPFTADSGHLARFRRQG
jgi:hypothetical protein